MESSKTEHLSLICDIGELSNLVSESKDIDNFLQQVVHLVAAHLNADVGSIYLLEAHSDTLVLKATVGLHPDAVERVRMEIGEGLVGWTLEQMAPVCEGDASSNPRFKYFETSMEERFKSFLSVPIRYGSEKTGVLVVQHTDANYFNPADVMALKAIAAQLAGTIAHARMMMTLNHSAISADTLAMPEGMQMFKGEAAVNGFALAPAMTMRSSDPLMEEEADDQFHAGLGDFRNAMAKTIDQLKQLQEEMVRRLPESAALIFEAHHMMLKDPRFVRQIEQLITDGLSAPAGIRRVARHFIDLFERNPNAYIREKSKDIEDLVRRLLFNLRKRPMPGQSPLDGRIVIATQLYPSDILKLVSESVSGIILVGGGVTSHVTIIARSLNIPTIIAMYDDLLRIPDNTLVLMDADVGTLYVDPSQDVCRRYDQRNRALRNTSGPGLKMAPQTLTRDKTRIHLMANINLLSELDLALALKAEGIGLYRSEFPFIVRSGLPSEEEQRLVYERLFDKMARRPVWVRTLDVGGDKVLPYLDTLQEDNPELGLRSIRFSLKYRDIFDQQVRAILRAGARAPSLGIMFPMISSIDEFRTACQTVRQAIAMLNEEKLPHHREPKLGAMIELPAIVEIIDELAREADFLSIGTNDFTQYMLAADRTNKHVAAYYQPYHPSVLRALARIIQRTSGSRVPVSVCGEVAHQKDFVPFLIGIGIRRLSVDPQFLPVLQRSIRALSITRAEAYARQLLSASTFAQVEEVRKEWAWGSDSA
jgi:phosphotransferase system enzyme I (PtsP)